LLTKWDLEPSGSGGWKALISSLREPVSAFHVPLSMLGANLVNYELEAGFNYEFETPDGQPRRSAASLFTRKINAMTDACAAFAGWSRT